MARATALGSAQADWLDAIHSADVTAMTTLHTAWNIDFTQHHVDLAMAKQTWWSGFRSNLLSYVSDVTNEWQTEQTSANLAWGTYSAALGAAESARTTAENDAIRDARVHVATAYEVREQAVADATELLQQGWADAEAGQTGLHALATSAFGAAVAEPSARFDVVSAATEFWLASQFHDAETAYAAAVGPAYQTYLTDSSNAARTRRVNEANRTSAFEQLWASDFASALGTFALTNPSPWATFAAAQANAEAVRVGSIAPARATTESGLAQADHDFLTGLAGELATWLVASTGREQWQSLSEAEARLGAVLASADDRLASSGGTLTGADLASTPSGSGVPSGFGSVWMSGPYSGSSTIGGTWTGSSSLLTTIMPPTILAAPYTPPADSSALPNNYVEHADENSPARGILFQGHAGSSAMSSALFLNRPYNAVYGDDDTPNPTPLSRDLASTGAPTPLGVNNLQAGQTYNEATGKVPEQVKDVLRGSAGDDVIQAATPSPTVVTRELKTVDANIVEGLVQDGLATKIVQGGKAVVVVPIPNGKGGTNLLVLESYTAFKPGGKGVASVYRVAGVAPGTMSAQGAADAFVFTPNELKATISGAASVTFLLHMVPFGAATDSLTNADDLGDVGEGMLSAAGDAAGFGLLSKSAKIVKISMAVNGAAGAVRGAQAINFAVEGDAISAAATGGEALLRLLGISGGASRLRGSNAVISNLGDDVARNAANRILSKAERLTQFNKRLLDAPGAKSADEALEQIGKTLDDVEDAFSGVPKAKNPGLDYDGRMYPPRADNILRQADGSIKVRTRGNRIDIGADGSITIYDLKGNVILTKPGG